jgi:hypothetical protein
MSNGISKDLTRRTYLTLFENTRGTHGISLGTYIMINLGYFTAYLLWDPFSILTLSDQAMLSVT